MISKYLKITNISTKDTRVEFEGEDFTLTRITDNLVHSDVAYKVTVTGKEFVSEVVGKTELDALIFALLSIRDYLKTRR